MTNKEIEFLKNLQNEILTQDTVCQASPRFWIVQGTVKEYGYESDYADGSVIVLDCESTLDDMHSAYEWLYEHDKNTEYICGGTESPIEYSREDSDDESDILYGLEDVINYIENHDIYRFDSGYPHMGYYKKVSKNYENTIFLTNRECKEHIEANYYHYPKDAHSYAMTAWRSPQVEELYRILETVDWSKIQATE